MSELEKNAIIEYLQFCEIDGKYFDYFLDEKYKNDLLYLSEQGRKLSVAVLMDFVNTI